VANQDTIGRFDSQLLKLKQILAEAVQDSKMKRDQTASLQDTPTHRCENTLTPCLAKGISAKKAD
jgi:hypothetical protein